MNPTSGTGPGGALDQLQSRDLLKRHRNLLYSTMEAFPQKRSIAL